MYQTQKMHLSLRENKLSPLVVNPDKAFDRIQLDVIYVMAIH